MTKDELRTLVRDVAVEAVELASSNQAEARNRVLTQEKHRLEQELLEARRMAYGAVSRLEALTKELKVFREGTPLYQVEQERDAALNREKLANHFWKVESEKQKETIEALQQELDCRKGDVGKLVDVLAEIKEGDTVEHKDGLIFVVTHVNVRCSIDKDEVTLQHANDNYVFPLASDCQKIDPMTFELLEGDKVRGIYRAPELWTVVDVVRPGWGFDLADGRGAGRADLILMGRKPRDER